MQGFALHRLHFWPTASARRPPARAPVLIISAAWPTLQPASYLRWRVPALAFLQLFLFALPFNFSTEVFDVLAPHPGTGRMAWVLNVFQLAMSEWGAWRQGRARGLPSGGGKAR